MLDAGQQSDCHPTAVTNTCFAALHTLPVFALRPSSTTLVPLRKARARHERNLRSSPHKRSLPSAVGGVVVLWLRFARRSTCARRPQTEAHEVAAANTVENPTRQIAASTNCGLANLCGRQYARAARHPPNEINSRSTPRRYRQAPQEKATATCVTPFDLASEHSLMKSANFLSYSGNACISSFHPAYKMPVQREQFLSPRRPRRQRNTTTIAGTQMLAEKLCSKGHLALVRDSVEAKTGLIIPRPFPSTRLTHRMMRQLRVSSTARTPQAALASSKHSATASPISFSTASRIGRAPSFG